MALNLSRNTKVFVSSVNGVPTQGGQFLTGYIDENNAGSGFSDGDRILFDDAAGSTTANAFYGIVESTSNGAVTALNINGNGVGHELGAETLSVTADNDQVWALDGTENTTADALEVEVVTAGTTSSPTTSQGSRAATGKFVGNGTNANTFRIGVLDGYSFSQGSESTDVSITEAGATPSRGSKRFNDALPPAEWSFATYVRPFVHGTDSWRASGVYDMCENILWSALAGTGLSDASGAAVDTTSTAALGSNVVFTNSNKHELLKINIYFVLENTTYRLNDAQIGTAEIDFSIDGIAQITWSGSATTIDQVTTATEDPSKYIQLVRASDADDQTSGNTDTYTETYTYADSTGPSDANYLRNKLSSLYLDVNSQGGGSASQGLDAREYDINITGGSITVENNVTYVTPETIGIVDKPIGSFTGARTISGSLTMYLDTKTNGSNQLLSDLAGATDLVSNSFDMSLLMGQSYTSSSFPGADRADNAHIAGDFSAPGVEFFMPKCHLTVPSIEVGDLISVSLEFSAQGDTLLTTDEMSVKYLGSTSHSDDRGYDEATVGTGTNKSVVVAA
jgi:hypothetical protein